MERAFNSTLHLQIHVRLEWTTSDYYAAGMYRVAALLVQHTESAGNHLQCCPN